MNQIKKGYKQTKVGIIPEDWEYIKIKDIVKVSQGLQIAINDRFTTPAFNRVFYITIPFIEGKKEEYIENPKQSILCTKDDILVVRTGSGVGKIIRGVEGAFHNNFFKVKPFDNINIDFFYYFLISPKIQFLMSTYAGNSAIPDLNHSDFYSLDFLIPPLKEQEKIAEILTTWDEAITKQEKLIKAKELQKKALMQKLLSGEVRFGGFCDEWEEVRLGDVCDIKKGEQLNKDTLDIDGDFPVINGGIEPSGYTEEWNTESNTITISEGGNSCGYVNFLQDRFWSGGHCYTLLNLEIDKIYLYQFLKYNQNNIMKLRVGSGLPNIQKSAIEKFLINKPIIKEQQKIAEVLSLADNEINLLKNELEELKLQKKALMQKLLTGEVRVKV